MKLSKLIIKNFRGLKGENNIIDFSNSNIIFLIGQNNAGKSSYLRAYEFFINPKQIASQIDFYNNDSNTPIEIEGEFLKENFDDEDINYQGSGKQKDQKWMEKWVDSKSLVKVKKIWSSPNKPFEKYTFSPVQNDWVQNGFGGMDSLFSNAAPTPISINAMEDESSLEEKVNKLIQERFIKKMHSTHAELCKDVLEKIKELQEAITSGHEISKMNDGLNEHFKKTFSDLSLKLQSNRDENIKPEDAFKKNFTIAVQHDNTTRQDAIIQNGHGIIRQALFNFLSFLKESATESSKKEYIILFEEPELFLHPSVAFKLRESLYDIVEKSPYQVLCATHSPLMIDMSKPHMSLVRIVKDDKENTISYQLSQNVYCSNEDSKQRVQMINRFNPHVCEAFFADKVLLVEGDTETIVYRALINEYYPNSEIFVLNTGSKNNIPFFQTILTAFNIEHYAIHDVDTEYINIVKNGQDTQHKNSAWKLNSEIWDLVETANKKHPGLARRYTHNANFENAHKYKLSGSGKDKPFSANAFVNKIISGEIKNVDCKKWLDDIMGGKSILHDMTYIDSIKKTVSDIKIEEDNYQKII